MVGVVAEIQLLQFDHQATQVHAADAGAFTQHPVIPQDFVHQTRTLSGEELLITALGVEARNQVIGAAEQRALWAEVLAEAVFRQAVGLFTQGAIHHGGLRFGPQDLTCLGHQAVIKWIDKSVREQATEMFVQAILHRGVADVAQRPIGCDPFFEPGRIPALGEVEHQVGAQAAQQSFAIIHVGAHMRFKGAGDAWQQLFFQFTLISFVEHRVTWLALIKPVAFMQLHITERREYAACGVARVQQLKRGHGVILRRQLGVLFGQVLRELSQLFKTAVVGRKAEGPEQAERSQRRKCRDVQRTLAPMDTAALALVEACEFGFGENHAA